MTLPVLGMSLTSLASGTTGMVSRLLQAYSDVTSDVTSHLMATSSHLAFSGCGSAHMQQYRFSFSPLARELNTLDSVMHRSQIVASLLTTSRHIPMWFSLPMSSLCSTDYSRAWLRHFCNVSPGSDSRFFHCPLESDLKQSKHYSSEKAFGRQFFLFQK